ncbi:MAG: site-2 protease family protein, partial [Acidobacteria bacterium]|nr:site-2 protease family protein [Acidobacteriota bacterium]
DPGATRTACWVAGVVISVVFFASLVAHELAHTIVARRHGIAVDSITLWLLGGVSRFTDEPTEPGVELRLSAAGPATSLVLGVGWWILAVLLAWIGLPELWVGSLLWLAFINLVLAVFNMLPAFPLDGGRVLRSLLWRRTDRTEATRVAVLVGRGFAFGLVGLGVLLVFGGALVSGVWFMLLGWFIEVAGRMEQLASTERDLGSSITIEQLMVTPVATVDEQVTLDVFLHDHVLGRHHSAFPVMHDGSVLGMIGLEDLRRVPMAQRAATTTGEIATPLFAVAVIDRDATVAEAIAEMARLHSSRALVFDQGALIGIVTNTDLVRALQVHALEGGGAGGGGGNGRRQETARSGDSS